MAVERESIPAPAPRNGPRAETAGMIYDPFPDEWPAVCRPEALPRLKKQIGRIGVLLTIPALSGCTPEICEQSIQAFLSPEPFWGATKGFVLGLAALPLTTHGMNNQKDPGWEIGLRFGGPLAVTTALGAVFPKETNGVCLAVGITTVIWGAQELSRKIKK